MPSFEEIQKVFSKLNEEMQKVLDWITKEVSLIRGERITPQLIANIKVNAYSKELFLKEIATIFSETPRSLVIKPWDRSLARTIEKSLYKANLGGSIRIEEGKVFLSFQSLTQEERERIFKTVKEKIEEAKRGLYRARDKTWSKIQKLQREKVISEDEKYKKKKELEKTFQQFLEKIEKLKEKKEKEILF